MQHDAKQRDPLEEIERKACNDPCFSESEKGVIREMIRVYRGWQFVGKVVRGVVVILGGAAAAIAAIKTILGNLP